MGIREQDTDTSTASHKNSSLLKGAWFPSQAPHFQTLVGKTNQNKMQNVHRSLEPSSLISDRESRRIIIQHTSPVLLWASPLLFAVFLLALTLFFGRSRLIAGIFRQHHNLLHFKISDNLSQISLSHFTATQQHYNIHKKLPLLHNLCTWFKKKKQTKTTNQTISELVKHKICLFQVGSFALKLFQ